MRIITHKSENDLNLDSQWIQLLAEQIRKQVAYDLHDSGKYLLLELKTTVKSVMFNYKSGSNIENELKELEKSINQLGQKLNDIIEENAPIEVQEGDIILAISTLVKRLNTNLCRLHFDYTDESIILQEEICIQVYRILQELLCNIIKHNQSKTILIDIHRNSNIIELDLCYDANIEFLNAAQINCNTGIGLFSIESRLKSINGKIEYLPGSELNQRRIVFLFSVDN